MTSASQPLAFKVGDTAEIIHSITLEDIRKFVELTGDDNPLHVDRKFAEQTTFKGIVAHGMLSASFISTIIGKHIPGKGALWMSQSLEFLLPVRIGDQLHITATVITVQLSQRILTLKTEIKNQHHQLILTGESRVKALEDESPVEKKEESPRSNVVIVTGASRGIGAAIGLLLGQRGFSVVLNYNTDEAGARDVQRQIESEGGTALAVKGNVTNRQDVKQIIATAIGRYGHISAVVNNAAPKIINKPFADLTIVDLATHMEVQYYGAFNLIHEAIPYLEKNPGSSVVNLGSIIADNVPAQQQMHYAAAKAALISMTRSLAAEYGPRGIRFNIVSPGMTSTSLIADMPEKAKLLTKMQTPLRRLAGVEDVAHAIAFLLSPEARHITGENLRVCGGSVMI